MISLARRPHRPTTEGDEDSEAVEVATAVRDVLLPITTSIRDAQITLIGSKVIINPGVGMVTTRGRISIQTDHQATRATLRNRGHATGLIETGPYQAQQHTRFVNPNHKAATAA